MSFCPMATFQIALIFVLMPATLIYGVQYDQNVSLSGARLVLKTRSGLVLEREERGAVAKQPGAAPTTPMASGDNKRPRKNKKSKKSQDHLQPASTLPGGRNSGFKKLNDSSQHTRQMIRQHQQVQLQQDGNEKWPGSRVKTSENSKASTCRYAKSVWSDCDSLTNMRTRTLSLKKGETNCLPTRTIQKKCKKACRYDKGSWSDCFSGQITREDKLRPSDAHTGDSEQSCDPVRKVYKKCNSGDKQRGVGVNRSSNKERKHKEKGTRRILQTQV